MLTRILAIVTLCLSVNPAFAHKGKHGMKAHHHAFMKACKADIQTFCKDAGADAKGFAKHEAVMNCLAGHIGATDKAQALSADCNSKMEKAKEWMNKRAAVQTACKADIAQHCGGEEHFMPCLFKNKAALSSDCQAALPQHDWHPEKG